MKIGTQYIFPTPIWRTNIIPELEKHNITIEDLINQCLEMKAKDQGRIVSNIGKTSYQGNNFFFNDIQKTPFEKTWQILHDIVNSIYNDTWCGELNITNAWININEKEALNGVHNHPDSILAGCLYLQVPKNGGNFHIRRNCTEDFIYHRYGQIKTDSDNNPIYQDHIASEIAYTPAIGEVIVFPAHIMHYVGVNKSDIARFSVAFNCA